MRHAINSAVNFYNAGVVIRGRRIGCRLPNAHKIYRMYTIYFKWPENTYTYQLFSFEGPPKVTQIWIFCFENLASGNPAVYCGQF
jgi:hypothetical protein